MDEEGCIKISKFSPGFDYGLKILDEIGCIDYYYFDFKLTKNSIYFF
ncbi:MAG: hypothetical protein KGD66_00800 [Candidatus Lokiarchaeota archaeon]|nr:hypothetical protein [Candidatus Lokiarchaeota archaeon]